MTVPGENRLENVVRRYPLAAQAEWRKLLEHFDLATGFAFVVLLVPDSDGAELCRHELQTRLERGGRRLHTIELSGPDELRTLPGRFLELAFPPEAACVWLGSVVPDYVKDYADWRSAWEFALARLNAYRNPIREHCQFTLIFAGAPWLQEVLREIAPDLWSVRTLVVRIQPQAASEEQPIGTEMLAVQASDATALDPHFALEQAEKFRGVGGQELTLARLLHRAGKGFARKHDWKAAVDSFTEALDLRGGHGAPSEDRLDTLLQLGWACQVVGDAQRALKYAGSAHELALAIGDRRREAEATRNLASAYADLGDRRKAVELMEKELAIRREVSDRREEAAALIGLGTGISGLGDSQRAVETYNEALVVAHEVGDKRLEAIALVNLCPALVKTGDVRRALQTGEQALRIARELHECRVEGYALINVGQAHQALNELAEAKVHFDMASSCFARIGSQHMAAAAFWESAQVSNRLHKRTQAVASGGAALRLFEAIGDSRAGTVRATLAKWRRSG